MGACMRIDFLLNHFDKRAEKQKNTKDLFSQKAVI